MILFDSDILEAMSEGLIVIDPFDRKQLGTNSYDARLGDKLLVYSQFPLDMRKSNAVMEVLIPEDGLVLQPGIVYLGSTVEVIGATGIFVPHIEGRSSIGRLGMSIHCTAGFGDCNFRGQFTLEITVVHPLRIYPGVRIAQAYFLQGKGKPDKLYCGKYTDQFNGPIASRMHQDEG